jgi:SpoVK/Ycf46/Vps4 family AAA+-type ATPase
LKGNNDAKLLFPFVFSDLETFFAGFVSLKHKLKKHLQLQSASANQVDRRWLNGFMAAGFHSGLISLSDLKLEYMKAHRNAYGERMTEAQEQQLERRLTKLCQMD